MTAPPADRLYFGAFLDLRGKPGVVVGGGEVAAAKAETLLRSGVRVTVIAPELCTRLAELAVLGAVRQEPRRFQPGDLVGAEVVIAATDDPAVNEAVSVAAKALRAPVNVADNAALSTFIMPAVVDRSPMQIAISTGGASPVLARRLRAMIEAAVPFAFGRLAALAARFRPVSRQRHPDAVARRRFWERVIEGPIADLVLSGHEREAVEALQRELDPGVTPDVPKGTVYLVGGGPGNPDLLTLRALRVLQHADVLLYDNLVSPAIIDLARREAERIYVGKKAADHALKQEEINDLLVHLAKAGKRVVRLKGGDPFIFGRGGEEIETLASHRISFEVVPGVTAASGASAYAGIPLTHRDYAHSCVFVTGHLQDGEPELDWEALATPRQTIVIYMGVRALPRICERLIAHGLAPDFPAAIVQGATRERQRVLPGTLATLAQIAAREKVKPPALVIVGEVVRLREKFSWYTPAALGSEEETAASR
ncbi:MAG: uroporphyrinogen-III C-methyltransferase [Betaproteobacteria bacterium RIFCSPLOWO2_02_67_12]|nr:MAG: uroporphyrinogen-III C-methyltransferase [Betaproteobacteria bacterium RIFCSPLOWO2_02_67_12]OGA31215.1 MAG: uroporphyrinogen-III C-methyltransferase [Betaproteobacteria bacterium RIFCSPLOWO2_02_FULL_68_150]OGA55109.1 MAG: uroporphyrinogen-III C-methyltransferase [Betaproteobacteria bacterium RIFCSPLOWO2_12_FULL_67_28]